MENEIPNSSQAPILSNPIPPVSSKSPEYLKKTGQTKYASFFGRYISHTFDTFIFLMPVFLPILFFPQFREYFLSNKIYKNSYFQITFTLLYDVYLIFALKFCQKTLGKYLLGQKIIREDGSEITWGKAILREVIIRPFSHIFLLGYLYALINSKHQTFHDKIAGVVVIQEKDLSWKRKILLALLYIFFVFTFIGTPIYVMMIHFKEERDRTDLTESVDQKFTVLQSVKDTPYCGEFFLQAQESKNNFCLKAKKNSDSCQFSDLSITQLSEYNKNLEDLISSCIQKQIEYQSDTEL